MKRNILFIMIFSITFMVMGCAGDPCISQEDDPRFDDVGGCSEGEYCNTDANGIQMICSAIIGKFDFLSEWASICTKLDEFGVNLGECTPL